MRNTTKFSILFAALTLGAADAAAQYVPKHPHYVTYITGGKSFVEYFPTWEPGQELSEDENFFISRVKLKDRFVNRNSQVVPDNEANNQRKFSLCTPMGISDTYWQTLPRGVMDGDTFGMWSYIDYQDGWSQSWIRNVGAYSDVCHKNGVQNSGGVVFFDSWGGDNSGSNAVVNMLTTKNTDGTFKYLNKFVQFLRYYGIDGVTFNPEGKVPNAALLQDFFIAVREKCATHGMKFHVNWYAVSDNNGTMTLASVLNPNHQNWFVKNGKEVCDVYFLNYEWTSSIPLSTQTAERLKAGSTNNLFAGYDIQGNWMGRGSWTALANTNMSICFWGNHTTDMIYQNSTELGSSDENVQRNYLTKQEQVFSGGNRNPAATPAIVDGIGSSSTASMKKFHGVAALMPARSTLQQLPFVTRFSLGNGHVFRSEGQPTFNNKWYSLSSQDYLPTWRWWITDADGNVPSDAVECSFTFDDSWYAGSCMSVSGTTNASNIRLFKTNFDVTADADINIVYKLLTPADDNGTTDNASHARLFWSFVGSESTLHFAEIGDGSNGQWTNWHTTAGDIGMTGKVAVLGISYTNTPQNYKMLVGELGIVPQHTFSPVKPTITRSTFLDRTYNGISYKLIWDCGKSAASKADASVPTYNEDVDTWYYEVYSQAKGQPEKLDGVTTSWAHYIVGAYAEPSITEYRFGVCAVAPDGKTRSEIAWTDWNTTDISYVEGVTVDRPVIKAGETFTVNLTDPTHPAVGKWRIVNPATGEDMMTPATDATSITGSINQEGTYDLILSDESESAPTNPATSGPVLSADQIVDGGIYYIYTTKRGGLTVKSENDTRIWGTSESGVSQTVSASNPLQHFQFEKSGGNYYLKNVATGKYVSKSKEGTLVSSTSLAAPILFTEAGSGSVRLYFDNSFNINLGGDKQVTIDNWNTKDDGNSFIIMPADLSGSASSSQPTTYRGLIQISPAETGSVPTIIDFNAASTEVGRGKETEVTFDVKAGEGKVSRGLKMDDGLQLRIPKEALPANQRQYSVGFWVKPDLFAHSKYGTNLINKRDVSIGWPHNNWGAFWVIAWPQQYDGSNTALDENVISYTMYNSESGNRAIAGTNNANIHETPYYRCTTDRHLPCGETYALQPDTWSHIMITYDGSTQSIYFNGKKAVSCPTSFVQYNESPIYIGGSNVYHAGIKGTIDDVQVWHKALSDAEVLTAMKGFEGQTVPDALKAYYTFEETNADNTFPNHGSGAAKLTAAYVKLEGAAGENTSSTVEITVLPTTDVLGNPSLPGSLNVSTTATLTTSNPNTNPRTGIIARIQSLLKGSLQMGLLAPFNTYDVTLTLSNMWGSTSLTKEKYITCPRPGDVNRDGTTDLADVSAILDIIMGGETSNYSLTAADVNGDGTISIVDMTLLIATFLK